MEIVVEALPPTKNDIAFALKFKGIPMGQNGRYAIHQSIHAKEDQRLVSGPADTYFLLTLTHDSSAPVKTPQ